jgi:hypothetical protein
MLRTLKPIEIAEGALLADIAVIYQLLVNYVPFVGDIFRFPIFIVFAILVLRRGLYVGIMSSCVALFLGGMLMGPLLLPMFGVEILGGLYLGVMMRSRVHPAVVILLGTTCGALTLYLLVGTVALLTGVPLTSYVQFLHSFFRGGAQFLDHIALRLGDFLHAVHGFFIVWLPFLNPVTSWVGDFLHHDIVGFWQLQMVPLVMSVSDFAFTYWWLTIYILLWGTSLFSTFLVYTACNLCVRLLGYEVRAFPSERLSRQVQRTRRRLVRKLGRSVVFRRLHAKI